MKAKILKLMFLLLFVTSFGYSQKVAVIGTNHLTPDGFSFLVTQDLANAEIIYFTENEYNDTSNAFDDQAEATVAFTAGSIILKGTVVFVNETATDTFSVSCTGGGICGTAVKVPTSGFFSLASDGETFYAYSDTDNNPANGVTTIHSVMFTGDTAPAIVNGGPIPVNQNPSFDYPTAIVIDGFPAVQPNRVEFNPTAPDRTNVTKVGLENPSNYVHAQANAALSTIFFTNFNLTGSNPTLTVTASPTSVAENSGTGMVYTFSLSANAGSNLTVNFNVGGSAVFSTDYTQTGAATYNASTGTVTILSGSNSATITITPSGDSSLEPNETVVLTLTAGTGYDAGSPGAATTTIVNDDTSNTDPLVALTGISHTDPDGFSFVAVSDIPANTVVYFTENSYNNTTLLFGTGEAVMQWTSPASVTPKGNVIVVTETAPDTFAVTCSSGGCGTIALLSGNLAIATTGETNYAYSDTDSNPSNGVTDIYSVLFTGTSTVSGGAIPGIEDPSTVYTNAVVVDGFPATAPLRTEYDPTKRAIAVSEASFEDVSNWIHGQAPPALSTVPFALLNILCTTPPTPTFTQVDPICTADTLSALPTTSNNGIMGTWAPALNNTTTTEYTFTPDLGQCGTTTTMTITVNPIVTPTFTQVAPICSGATLSALPTTSNNLIIGSWSPALNNMTTTTYTFTPNIGQCATTATMTIVVNPSTSTTTTVAACDSFIWTVNATTYTSSGTYTAVSGCDTQILELTINTTPTITIFPVPPSCEGIVQTILSSVTQTNIINGFSGAYDIANWTFSNTNANGNVNTAGAPSSIVLTGGDNGSNAAGNSDFTITIPNDSTISFDWAYSTGDGAQFDIPRVLVNGSPSVLTGYSTSLGTTPQSGSMSVSVSAGNTFSFNMNTADNLFGPATVAISNLVISSQPTLLWTASNGGTIVGPNNQLNVNISTTGTYTLTATNGTCMDSEFVDVTFVTPVTPLFAQVGPICSGSSFSLPATSNNSIPGTWAPTLDNTTTTTYTFTPDSGQCATTTTMTVIVNPSTSTTTTVAACDTYTWSVNSTTYTASGIYTEVSGCDTQILQLTINTFPVTSPYEVCQGQTVIDGLVSNLSATPVPNFSGDTTGAPTFNRPNDMTQGGVCSNNTGSGISVSYATHSFVAPATGSYTFSTCGNATWDTFLAIYASPFNPAGLCAGNNLVVSLDDSCGLQTQISANLVQGVNYTMVVCGFSSAAFGTYTVVTTNPIGPSNVEWYVAAVGGSPIATGSPFNPVGVPGSGILNTNTPGATTFYAQFPGTECRTPAVFTINATPNAPTGASSQSFSAGSTLANVIVTGANIQWYDAANSGNLLPTSTVLVNGIIYYATQTVNGCESSTFPVTISIGTGVTNVIPTQCGVTLDVYNSIVYANYVANAERYRFRVRHTGTNQIIIRDYALRNLFLSNLSFYEYDQDYAIEVAVRRNNIWEPFGTSCTVRTPIATTQAITQCGSMLTSNNQLIYATIVARANGYRFRVKNMTTLSVQLIDKPIRVFAFGEVTDYSSGTNYEIDVAVLNTDNNYLPFGAVCTVMTPVATKQSMISISEFNVVGYPNPFDDSFRLDVKTSSEESMQIKVYDMLGKLIDVKDIQYSDIENLEIGSNYPSGVYNIIVSQNDNLQTIRMVKR